MHFWKSIFHSGIALDAILQCVRPRQITIGQAIGTRYDIFQNSTSLDDEQYSGRVHTRWRESRGMQCSCPLFRGWSLDPKAFHQTIQVEQALYFELPSPDVGSCPM